MLSDTEKPIMKQFIKFTSYFNNYIFESIRLLKYADMGFEMAMRNEWVISGMMSSHFLANLFNFFLLFGST